MEKLRIRRITDPRVIDRLVNELDAPAMIGGNTFDGVIVRADEYRAWSQSDGETKP